MKIWLGLQLEEKGSLPRTTENKAGEKCFTPRAFVQWLEAYYGQQFPAGDIDYLRCEQYRQLCLQHLYEKDDQFYAAAFAADQRATAEELLSRRDELISAGYPLATAGDKAENLPLRIRALSELEQLLRAPENDLSLKEGFADRLHQLIASVSNDRHPALEIHLHEPRELLPPGLLRLLNALEKTGSQIIPLAEPKVSEGRSDLFDFQSSLRFAGKHKFTARGDGSLLILRAARETHIAAYLARLLRNNSDWHPALLLPDRNQTLNNALTLEGLPDLGIPVSSLARPSLQVLKLVTTFLWEPVDLRKTIEFLNLIVKPFDRHFATRLARSLAASPGLNGPEWNRTVAEYLNDILPKRAAYDRKLKVEAVKEQYNFWFGRRRYRQEDKVPKAEVRALFGFLLNWTRAEQSDLEGANLATRKVLGSQCQRLLELIDTLPEKELSFLETDRLVRTVYEPTPTTFQEQQLGHYPTFFAPAAIFESVERLVWWDFTEQDTNYFFSRWTRSELDFLALKSVKPLSPKQRNDRQVWQYLRPVLHTNRQLVLCLSDHVDGEEVLPHPLMGDLEAVFGASLEAITVSIDEAGNNHQSLGALQLPDFQDQSIEALPPVRMKLSVARKTNALQREYETPTSLDKLIYYPYQYVFQYVLRLTSNDILSVSADNRLMGNLGHRLIEELLETKADDKWNRQQTHDFVDAYVPSLLRQEGATLLEYGKEPERVLFTRKMRQASWALLSLIQDNHWRVSGTEVDIEGHFQDSPFKGRADLVLERKGNEKCIIDLKWRGKSVFRSLIKNQEDLQLSLYATTLDPENPVYTAYFIISDGIMIARNELAFSGLDPVAPEEDYAEIRRSIIEKMKATYDWRREQLARGEVEVRTEQTAAALEDDYAAQLNELLEMKNKDASWDDYRSLIGLLQ